MHFEGVESINVVKKGKGESKLTEALVLLGVRVCGPEHLRRTKRT